MSDAAPVISLRNLSFSYTGVPVIENADLDIHKGSTVIFVGPNGGGKTTLLRLILGLEEPQNGYVEVFGGSPAAARSRIGYMPQHAGHDRLFPVSVQEVVLMGLLGPGRYSYHAEDRRMAMRALERVGMADMARRQYPTLSGGQRQRVLMARALVSMPELLLFDEPTSMIDAATQGAFAQTLESVRGDSTVVIVSHDLGFVSGIVDHAVFVNRSVSSRPVESLDVHSFEALYGEHLHLLGSDRLQGGGRGA